MNKIVEQLENALLAIARAPQAFQLVIVMGPEGPDCKKIIRYFSEECNQLESELLEKDVKDDSEIGVTVRDHTIFFHSQKCQHLPDAFECILEQFLLMRLFKHATTVHWLNVIDYYSVQIKHGASFKEFYIAYDKIFASEIKKSVQWIATGIPNLEIYSSKHLLKECRKVVPEFPSNITELFFTVDEQPNGPSADDFVQQLQKIPSARMPLSLAMNEHSADLLLEALENQYTQVSELFLEGIATSDWIRYALDKNNFPLVEQLVKKLILTRMADPYDPNYEQQKTKHRCH
jgi:hypothetical protein